MDDDRIYVRILQYEREISKSIDVFLRLKDGVMNDIKAVNALDADVDVDELLKNMVPGLVKELTELMALQNMRLVAVVKHLHAKVGITDPKCEVEEGEDA